MPKPKIVDRTPEALKALGDRIEAAEREMQDAEFEYERACLGLINETPPKDVDDLLAEGATLPFVSGEVTFGHAWECPDSPTAKCVYHDETDPAHDNCIYCHQPEERK